MTREVSTIGVDLQYSRTVIALREGTGQQMHASLVGDGRRRLVPNAIGTDGAWGSAAVEVFLGQVGGIAVAADQILGWRVDPWSPPFLRGLRDRLAAYLGEVSPTLRHGYDVCICTDQAGAVGWDDRRGEDVGNGPPATARSAAKRCAAAGLSDVTFVRPTDALLCRWLASWLADPAMAEALGPDPASESAVLVVACGESWTATAGYSIARGEARQPVSRLPGITGRIDRGGGDWSWELARDVMRRCREGTPADSALAVLDATLEFGAFLGTQLSDEVIEWSGPLADVMFSPLRIRRRDQAAQKEIRLTADGVAELVAKGLPEAGPARPAIIVGGIGAVWPFITEALEQLVRDRARLWRSSEPEHDLAVGAAWWPELRWLFTVGGGPRSRALSSGAEVDAPHVPDAIGITGPRTGRSGLRDEPDSAPPRRLEDIPPWKRDE